MHTTKSLPECARVSAKIWSNSFSLGIPDKGLLLTDLTMMMVTRWYTRHEPVTCHVVTVWSITMDKAINCNSITMSSIWQNSISMSTTLTLNMQVMSFCPHIQRLNLEKNRSLRLEELQAIATYAVRLNLMEISTQDSY